MSILDSSCLKFVFLRFLPDQTLLSSNVSFHRSNLGGEFPHLVIYQAKPTIRHLPSHHRLFALRQERCRSEEHTSELQSRGLLVCCLLLHILHCYLHSFPTRRSSDLFIVPKICFSEISTRSNITFVKCFVSSKQSWR